jgi:glycosyltransferase involved in cell wall biosynthesis
MAVIRVAYDHQVFATQQYGGISRYFVELAGRVALDDRFSAEVIAPLHFNALLRASEVPVCGFYTHPSPKTTGRYIRAANRVLNAPYLWARSPDILHETYYANGFYRPAKTGLVVTVYDMIHEKFPHLFNPNDVTRSRKRATVQQADKIICISEHTRHDLIELLDVPPERTCVVHLGFTLTQPPNVPSSIAPLPEKYLLFVGERPAHKNFTRLLEAYASSARLQNEVILVAFGRLPFSPGELEKMRQLGIREGRVIYRSGTDDILAQFYAHASAFVCPSLYEGFGLPLLEAMSFRCPVVCSNTSSIPEVVGDAALFFDPSDSESMAHAIERILFDSDLRDDLVSRGNERIKQFSWDRCARETMQVYQETVQ